jgi:hypothetical protein
VILLVGFDPIGSNPSSRVPRRHGMVCRMRLPVSATGFHDVK